MGKLLVLVLLVAVAMWLVRRALRAGAAQAAQPRAHEGTAVADELVRCAHCGLLLPRAEARASGGAIYCSEEHARLGPGRSG
jgi:uncharacterized protein